MYVKIIGAGLSGIVSAILLKAAGHSVEIFETRNHIGGNCYDSNVCGVTMHNYGPHIFHTNDEEVWEFLNRYTTFKHFKYAPKGDTNIGLISLPYSLSTIEEIGKELTEQEIIDLVYRDYSEKQWGVPFEEISNSIIKRVPVLAQVKSPSWYHMEKYQGIPSQGYTAMMKNMLENITVYTGVDVNEWRRVQSDLTIYTGKIDEYYNYIYGELPYRSLNFVHTVSHARLFHHAINQCNSRTDYTREYDHSYFLDEKSPTTVITKEYPIAGSKERIPYYPMPFADKQQIYNKYKTLAQAEKNTVFIGRLATYKYLDMWMAIKQSMQIIQNQILK